MWQYLNYSFINRVFSILYIHISASGHAAVDLFKVIFDDFLVSFVCNLYLDEC